MERYFSKKRKNVPVEEPSHQATDNVQVYSSSMPQKEVNLEELPVDPAKRKSIHEFSANIRDVVRRHYWQRGPCQPKNYNFPLTQNGEKKRRFVPSWFNEHATWLEYSISKDAAFCLCCYLFKPECGFQAGGDKFVSEGFSNWKRAAEKLKFHVGDHNSSHTKCLKACEDLMNQKQHIDIRLLNESEQLRMDYRARLVATVDCIVFLLRQGLAFRGRDESTESNNKGNFLELLSFLADHNEDVKKVVLQNAPANLKLTAPSIQKDIVNAAAVETTSFIIKDVRDNLFSILVDESRDISVKEQMAIVLRYVDKRGCVIERFLCIVHVSDTTSLSLKEAIEEIFAKHGLSISSLRGQGYDGASNMQGQFNGLKSLIMAENSSAYYVHCFAHQLQLTLVAVAQKDKKIATFFNLITMLANVIGASCKRRDILREKQIEKLLEAIYSGKAETGRGLNQEKTLRRAGDTRWGSHHATLLSLISLFSSVLDVLEFIAEEGTLKEQRGEANMLLENITTFEFALLLHSMKNVLGITDLLSQALQRKDQDIVNAMDLVVVSKKRLQMMRDSGWEILLNEVSLFCNEYHISIPNMEDNFVARGRSRRRPDEVTNLHHYCFDIFYTMIDLQLQELNNRFNEVNTELLLCMACLNPSNSFSAFDKRKLMRFAEFYPFDFSRIELVELAKQLESYIIDVSSNERFSEVVGIGELSQKMVQTKKHLVYPLVFLLLKLALILPVATASVERAFSAMKIIKTSLRNRMGDDWMNDCLVTYIERDIFDTIDKESIIQRFQNMKNRRGVL